MCSPINYSNRQFKNKEDLLMLAWDFREENRFRNMHYLLGLLHCVEYSTNTLGFPISSAQRLCSKEAAVEFKVKLESVLENFQKKAKSVTVANIGHKKKTFSFLDFEYPEVFSKGSSVELLRTSVKLIACLTNLFGDLLQKEEASYQHEETPQKNLAFQQYIAYFYSQLVCLALNLRRILTPHWEICWSLLNLLTS